MALVLDKLRFAAQRVADTLKSHPFVQSIIVFGSVATETVDSYSDVDMMVICDPDIISLADRTTLLSQVGTGWQVEAAGDPAMFAYGDIDGMVDNVLVTVHYQQVQWVETVMNEVLEHGAITTDLLPFRPYTLPALLQNGWLLYDENQHVARWREASKVYPALLKQNLLQRYLPTLQDQTAEMMATANRNIGPRNFLFHLNWSVDALLSVLYALNDTYDPADRRAAQTTWPLLENAPVNFASRLTSILEGPFDADGMKRCAQQYSELVEDVTLRARKFVV